MAAKKFMHTHTIGLIISDKYLSLGKFIIRATPSQFYFIDRIFLNKSYSCNVPQLTIYTLKCTKTHFAMEMT